MATLSSKYTPENIFHLKSTLQGSGRLLEIIQEAKRRDLFSKDNCQLIYIMMNDGALGPKEIVLGSLIMLISNNITLDLQKSRYLSALITLSEKPNMIVLLKFLSFILEKGGNIKDILTLSDIEFFNYLAQFNPTKMHLQKLKSLTYERFYGVRPVLPASNDKPKVANPPECQLEAATINKILSDPIVQYYEPSFISIVPELSEIEDNELFWLDQEIEPNEPLWNPLFRHIQSLGNDIQDLFKQALTSTLSVTQLKKVISALQYDHTLIIKWEIKPETLTTLIQKNWILAAEVLSIVCDRPERDEYLIKLNELGSSVQVLEIVNALTQKLSLPKTFILPFLTLYIEYCSKMTDASLQNRYVRLVCTLIQTILKKCPETITDMLAEIQSFCLSNSNTKEALDLYSTIKAIDGA